MSARWKSLGLGLVGVVLIAFSVLVGAGMGWEMWKGQKRHRTRALKVLPKIACLGVTVLGLARKSWSA